MGWGQTLPMPSSLPMKIENSETKIYCLAERKKLEKTVSFPKVKTLIVGVGAGVGGGWVG